MLEIADTSLARFAQEVERRRIARDLHDNVVQSLTALVADIEFFTRQFAHDGSEPNHEVEEKLEAWQELARDSLTSVRQTLGDLRSTSFENGLEQAIRKLLDDFHDAGYTLTYECTDVPTILPPEYTMHLYSIVREALTNISKHAQASHLTVFLFTHEGRLYLSIADNGVGMTHAHPTRKSITNQKSIQTHTASGYHQGLLGMQERVMLLGGQFSIESQSERGTRIDVDVPLPRTFTEC